MEIVKQDVLQAEEGVSSGPVTKAERSFLRIGHQMYKVGIKWLREPEEHGHSGGQVIFELDI